MNQKFWEEYQKSALSTAVYNKIIPAGTLNIYYPTAGLVGEIGELIEVIQLKRSEEIIIGEFGDILWYIADIYTVLNEPMSSEPFSRWVTAGAVSGTLLDLCKNSGLLMNQIKKIARDDKFEINDTKRDFILDKLKEISYNLWCVAASLNISCSMEDIARKNTEKLNERMLEGKLHGSDGSR